MGIECLSVFKNSFDLKEGPFAHPPLFVSFRPSELSDEALSTSDELGFTPFSEATEDPAEVGEGVVASDMLAD